MRKAAIMMHEQTYKSMTAEEKEELKERYRLESIRNRPARKAASREQTKRATPFDLADEYQEWPLREEHIESIWEGFKGTAQESFATLASCGVSDDVIDVYRQQPRPSSKRMLECAIRQTSNKVIDSSTHEDIPFITDATAAIAAKTARMEDAMRVSCSAAHPGLCKADDEHIFNDSMVFARSMNGLNRVT